LAASPQARFTLAGALGDGVSWATFARHHPALVGTSVVALGPVSGVELNALYARCTVFVAPSRYESFGLIYVEAMRHGKPVVGCTVGGVPDVVTHGQTGLLVPPDDAPALSRALIQLLDSPALRDQLGRNGREDFIQRFSARRMATESAALYSSILARRSAHANHART
jgi:glycosyltransferase involved in cell wall biosynthesis